MPLAENWRQEPGTPVYRSPDGSLSDETGTPAEVAKIRAALMAGRSPCPLINTGRRDAREDQRALRLQRLGVTTLTHPLPDAFADPAASG